MCDVVKLLNLRDAAERTVAVRGSERYVSTTHTQRGSDGGGHEERERPLTRLNTVVLETSTNTTHTHMNKHTHTHEHTYAHEHKHMKIHTHSSVSKVR